MTGNNIEFESHENIHNYRQQPSPLLYSIDIWPALNSRLTQRETNHYITRCASELAWPYLAGSSPGQLYIDLFAQHQRFAVCCQLIRLLAHNKKNHTGNLSYWITDNNLLFRYATQSLSNRPTIFSVTRYSKDKKSINL